MAQETFSFALNMTTNVPEVVRTIGTALDSLQRKGALNLDALRQTGEFTGLQKFIDQSKVAVQSARTVEDQVKGIADAYRQLAADAPQVAAVLSIKDLANAWTTMRQLPAEAVGALSNEMLATQRIAVRMANTGIAGFDEYARSIDKSNDSLREAAKTAERIEKANQSVERSAQRRRGETGQTFTRRIAGLSVDAQGNIETGVAPVERAMQKLRRALNFTEMARQADQQATSLRRASAALRDAGQVDAARGLDQLAVSLTKSVGNLRQISDDGGTALNGLATAFKPLQKALLDADKELTSAATAFGRDSKSYVSIATGIVDELGQALPQGLTRVRQQFQNAAQALVPDLQAVADLPGEKIPPALQGKITRGITNVMSAVVEGFTQEVTATTRGVQTRGAQEARNISQAAANTEKELTAARLDGIRASAVHKEALRQEAEAEKAAAAAATARRKVADADALRGANLSQVGSSVRSANTALEGIQRGLRAFDRAATDSARQSALNTIAENMHKFGQVMPVASQGVTDALNQLVQVSQEGQNTTPFRAAMDGLVQYEAALQRSAALYGQLVQQITAAEQQQQAAIAITAQLKAQRVDDTVLMAEQGRRQREANQAYGAANRGLNTFRKQFEDFNHEVTTDAQKIRIARAAARTLGEVRENVRVGQVAATQATGVQGAVSAAAQATAAGRTAEALLTETRAKGVVATDGLSIAEKQLIAMTDAAALSSKKLAGAVASAGEQMAVGSAGWFAEFKKGFQGTKQGPEVIGQTARISLLYGTAYRVLGVMSQVASDAFNSLTEFQVGLAELGGILGLSSGQVDAFGKAVLSSSAATGAAADDLLRATERVALVTGKATAPEAQVAQAKTTSLALGELNLITGQTADQMATYSIAIQQATGMTGNFVQALGDQAAFISKQTGAPVEDILKTTAQIGDLGAAIGLTTEQMMSMAGTIEVSTGQTADAVSGYLTQILTRFSDTSVQQRLSGLGVDTSKDILDQLKQMNTIFAKGGGPNASTALADSFGRGRVTTALLALIRASGEIANVAGKAQTGAAGTLQERAQKAAATFAGQIKKLEGSFRQLITTVGLMSTAFGGFLIALNSLLTVVNALVGTLSKVNIPDVVPVIGGTNVVGDILFVIAAFKLLPATLGVFRNAIGAADAALVRFAARLTGTTLVGGGADLVGKGGVRGGLGKAAGVLSLAGGYVGAGALIGVTAIQAYTSKVKENNEALKTATQSLNGLNSALSEDLVQAVDKKTIQQTISSLESASAEMSGFWDKLLSSETRTRLDAAKKILEEAAKTNDTATGLFTRVLLEQMATQVSQKPEDIRKPIMDNLAKAGASEYEKTHVGSNLTDALIEQFDALSKAINDAITNGVEQGTINLQNGLDDKEKQTIVDAAIGALDLSGIEFVPGEPMNQAQKNIVIQALKGFVGDNELPAAVDVANKALLAMYGTASVSVADAAKEINDITSHLGAITFRVPLFSRKTGVSGPGNPIPTLMRDLAVANQQVVDAEASGVESTIQAATENQQELAAKVQEVLARAMQAAQLSHARDPKSASAIKDFTEIAKHQLLATGGDVGQILDLLANMTSEVGRGAIASLRTMEAGLKAVIAAGRAAMARLAGYASTLAGAIRGGLPQLSGLANTLAGPLGALQGSQQAIDLQNLERVLAGIGDGLEAAGEGIIGAADVTDAAAEVTDTIAQIAAARELAEATRTGDKVAIATAQLHQAIADLATQKSNTVAYYNALAQVYQAQNELAQAQLDLAAQNRKFGSDLTDPVAQAQLDLDAATAAVQDAVNRGQAVSVVQGLQLEERTAANALEETKFREFMNQLDTNVELGRITDQQRIAALEAEKARLEAIQGRTYQQQQMLDEVEKALRAAAGEMDKQFNLGDIRLPTVYEVRRYIQTMTAGLDYLGSSINDVLSAKPMGAPSPALVGQAPAQGPVQGQTVVNNNIKIDGADVGMVKRVIVGTLGATEAGRSTTVLRKY